MADFEADASDESNDEDEQMDIDNDLIDDSEQENNDVNFFRFHNQTTDTDEVLREVAATEAAAIENMEANNYDEYDNENISIDEFENFEKKGSCS